MVLFCILRIASRIFHRTRTKHIIATTYCNILGHYISQTRLIAR